jgi:hypothetical protein
MNKKKSLWFCLLVTNYVGSMNPSLFHQIFHLENFPLKVAKIEFNPKQAQMH